MHPLRLTRIVVSTIVLLSIVAAFLDVRHLVPVPLIQLPAKFQLGPAFIDMVSGAKGAAVVVVLLVAVTLLFGRVYCSHLCPLGTIQDIVIWPRMHKYRHRKYPFRPTLFALHYGITAIVIVSAIGGSMLLLDLLEPFSNTGRLMVHVLRPVAMLGINGVSVFLRALDLGMTAEVPIHLPGVWTALGMVGFLGLIVTLSWMNGRQFCNLLCPVGGVLSLLSLRPVFAIRIRDGECIDCGLCERVCRARCIDSAHRSIDPAACVGCFDCLDSCPTHGMEFRWRRVRPVPAVEGDRRRALKTLSAVAVGTLVPSPASEAGHAAYDAAKALPVVPPGGIGREHFSALCTACQLCVSVCPTQVLQPSTSEYGWMGVFQPRMDYQVCYCSFDCVACSRVCPTGALKQLTVEEKHTLQIGKTTFVKEDCIVETKKKDCGACAEHCPTKAVTMVSYQGNLRIPEVQNDYCIGCGACEHACPTEPRRAIYITPQDRHTTAKKRPQERTAPLESVPQDFPF